MITYISSIKNTVNARLKIEGILLTMYESHTKAQNMTNDELSKNFGEYIFKTVIPKNIAITESEFFGKPSILFNVKAKGSLAYLNLAQEIIEKDSTPPPVI